MYRFYCFLILALCLVGQSPAQELTDSIGDMSLTDVPMTAGQMQQMRSSVSRAWWRAHRKGIGTAKNRRPQSAARHKADSLRRAVMRIPLEDLEPTYLYDMRLPVVSRGFVADTATYHMAEYMERWDSISHRPDAIFRSYEQHYDDLQQMEKERYASVYKYASEDPRRFRFARRKFDVPTQESQLIDTRNTVVTARLVDDAGLNLGDATLEGFGQSLTIKADRWHWKGDHTLQMQQTAISDNWYKGGENNMSVISQQKLAVSRYDENQKTTFDMTLDLTLSGYYTTSDTIHPMKVSDNLLSLDMKYGYKAWKKWYYSTQLYAKTPIFDQYKSNNNVTQATFLSPLEVNLSVGMDYKFTSPDKKIVYSLLLAPLSYNLKYVRDERVNPQSYGIDEDKFSKHEFGATLTSKLEWKMNKNISWSSRLYCFTTYSSTLVEFENTFNFAIGRFFSARIYAYPRFDDIKDNSLQTKEMLMFGFNYQW